MEASFDQNVSLSNLTATYMRTTFLMGGPLEIDGYRYQNKSDNETQQEEFAKKYVLKIKDIVQKAAGDDPAVFGA